MTNFIDAAVPIVAIISIFGMPLFIVWVALHFNNKKKEQFHASLQKLIESGQELTPELLQSIPGYVEEGQKVNDIKTGAILIGIGWCCFAGQAWIECDGSLGLGITGSFSGFGAACLWHLC